MRIQNVLVTGAGGFIGSHLAEKCVELGYKVRAFIRYNSRNSWGWLEDSKYKQDIEIFAGDIRDFDSVIEAMRSVDTVFHLAALIGIPYSYSFPLAYIRTNVEGTYNVLQSARMLQTENVLITSTSEVYGTAQYVPINEKHPVAAQSPYSATKIAADQLASSFFRSFGLPIKLARPFNTYGPRQSARAIIPTIITQILNGQKEIRLGNLHPTRDLTFVKDTINGFIEVAESDQLYGEVTNIGMNEEISIAGLIKLLARLMEVEIEVITDHRRIRPEKSEVERLVCDNSKLVQFTNWSPQYNLEAGLKETIAWFRENLQFYKYNSYNI
jgi:NAD dependent epimerase/dehydratase